MSDNNTSARNLSAPTAAVIVAAGQGTRAGGGMPKQFRPVGGIPLLQRTARCLADHPEIDNLMVVVGEGQETLANEALIGIEKRMRIVIGGADRQASVRAGLEALSHIEPAPGIVLIHDAARPFVPHAVIDSVIAKAHEVGGAIPVLPITDALLATTDDHSLAPGPDRAGAMRAQTPQGFRFTAILEAHRAALSEPLGAAQDDTAIAARAGLPVHPVPGAEENFKLTAPGDFARAEAYLASLRETRVGFGYDVHRFTDGDTIKLCGVDIPHTRALAGHSDADVGLHAATDAILGAIGAGDIGAHFPPSDAKWKGADSTVFLNHAAALVGARGGEIIHLDITLVCERPKIGPHRDAMRRRVAACLGLSLGRVSIKATTTERLGFTGRGEGIAAEAVATLSVAREDG